ncbi:MAG: TIGR02391 family protein [Chitinophagales bacterium]
MKFLKNILATEEDRIKKMKVFYRDLKLKKSDREDVLKGLTMFIGEYSSMIEKNLEERAYNKTEAYDIGRRASDFLQKHLGPSASLSFLKVEEPQKKAPFGTPGENILTDIASMVLLTQDRQWYSPEHHAWQVMQKGQLQYIEACIKNYGLHSSTEKRERGKFARYNVVVTFMPKGGKKRKTERRMLISKSVIEKEFLTPFASEKTILLNGQKIPHDSIALFRITETLLLDDEVKLYEEKLSLRTESEFIESCREVTNELLPNPDSYLSELSKELWSLVHPKFQKIVESNFKVKQYSEATRSVMIELNDIIKQEYKLRTGNELDGASLMTAAFSVNNPTFVLGDVTTDSGKNTQLGYMKLFEGAVIGIRNPVGHKNIQMSQIEAYEKIIFASHLLKMFEKSL